MKKIVSSSWRWVPPNYPDAHEENTRIDTEAMIEDSLRPSQSGASKPDFHEHPPSSVQSARRRMTRQIQHTMKPRGSKHKECRTLTGEEQQSLTRYWKLAELTLSRVILIVRPVLKLVAADSAIPELVDYSESNNFAAEMCLLGTTEA